MKTTNKRIIPAILASAITISLAACQTTSQTLQNTKYGTVDWSTAEQGYIVFTARGQERTFILQGPNGIQVLAKAGKDDSIKPALIDGTGRYQYAITNKTDDGKFYLIQYKNSFTVNSLN